jgi:hypothetical protein
MSCIRFNHALVIAAVSIFAICSLADLAFSLQPSAKGDEQAVVVAALPANENRAEPRFGEITTFPSQETSEKPPVLKIADGPATGTEHDAGEPPSAEAPSPDAPTEQPTELATEPTPRGEVQEGTKPTASIVILHIGDSHTSADYFTGEIRRLLQERYGRGGTGYMPAGRPPGFRSSTLDVEPSQGWTYASLQTHHARPSEFWLSGYDAIATAANSTIKYTSKYTSERLLPFEAIVVETMRQPGGGAIDIEVDGTVVSHVDLAGDSEEPITIEIPAPAADAKLRELLIKTTRKGKITIGSVSVYDRRTGVSYNSVGYLGATVGILNKIDALRFADDLKRIDPQIVVLSFGTNEAANPSLDIAHYSKSYEQVIDKIHAALPNAVIVIISPPDFNQLLPGCQKSKLSEPLCRRTSWDSKPDAASLGDVGAKQNSSNNSRCVWHTPTKLTEVRDAQGEIAQSRGLKYWNWDSVLPFECGANDWFKQRPPLMSPDHVHLTAAGYRKSAQPFVDALLPLIENVRVIHNAIPHN